MSDRRIAGLFFQNADMYPEKPAIFCDGREMTYRALARFVSQYANYLFARGVKRGDIIGIPMTNSIESVALMLAAACRGAGLAPINPTIPPQAVRAAFRAGNVRHVVARRAFFERLDGARVPRPRGCALCLDGAMDGADSLEQVLAQPEARPDCGGVTGRETLILTMTSGSTGAPKPIELTQENKLRRAFAHVSLYGITGDDRVLAATPLYHSLAERLVLMPLLIGATSVLLPRFTPDLWLNCVRDQRVTFTIAVSAQLAQIAPLLSGPSAPDVGSLRAVVSSSALLEERVRARLIDALRCDFHEMYGTSECSTVTSINFREAADKRRSVGRAIPGASVRILRDDGSVADAWEIGEIACRTELMFNGYYRQPEMTRDAFAADGYMRTGDLGCLDADGYLYFRGRKKELIITGGINVYPQDVEQAVMGLPGVAECAAFSYPDERLGEAVALAVVARPDSGLTRRAVASHCAKNLADFQQPHHVFLLDELPKNAMGKLARFRLIEAVRAGQAAGKASV